MKPSLNTYLDTVQLLKSYQGTHEANRTFALQHPELASKPQQMLLTWVSKYRFEITEPLNSKSYTQHFQAITQLSAFLFFVLGFLTGFGLLSYSGEAPVNVIYYLFIAMLLPIIGMILSIVSLLGDKNIGNFFAHFFPLYWLEKILQTLSPKYRTTLRTHVALPYTLQRWLFVERLQMLSLLFSVGLLIALLVMVVVKDIAFGWSTTLDVAPASFQSLLSTVGWIWHAWLPSAVPSIELVELSQYFRLGERLDSTMIANANRLGAWWQFLAMTTLLYAIGLRLLFWCVTRLGLQKALDRAFLHIDGIERLQRHFQTPFVTTQAPQVETHLPLTQTNEEPTVPTEKRAYPHIFGWNWTTEEMLLIHDSRQIQGKQTHEAGGSHTFSEDEAIARLAQGLVLLYVKAWEPPTMDFVDFLELLIDNPKVERIQLYPLGTPAQAYRSDPNDVEVWRRKLQGFNPAKVEIIDAT
ncbi:MAG: DUF2868 domain-containing protein [Campylobacterales bacterium]|nr:DUF2868 domain-containing protein [Campylobacterales bacterium]